MAHIYDTYSENEYYYRMYFATWTSSVLSEVESRVIRYGNCIL